MCWGVIEPSIRLQVKIRSWEQAIPDRTDDLLNAIQQNRLCRNLLYRVGHKVQPDSMKCNRVMRVL